MRTNYSFFVDHRVNHSSYCTLVGRSDAGRLPFRVVSYLFLLVPCTNTRNSIRIAEKESTEMTYWWRRRDRDVTRISFWRPYAHNVNNEIIIPTYPGLFWSGESWDDGEGVVKSMLSLIENCFCHTLSYHEYFREKKLKITYSFSLTSIIMRTIPQNCAKNWKKWHFCKIALWNVVKCFSKNYFCNSQLNSCSIQKITFFKISSKTLAISHRCWGIIKFYKSARRVNWKFNNSALEGASELKFGTGIRLPIDN